MVWENFVLRVAVAMLLGAVIGAERQLRQRLAGLRTNALVASGASLFVLVSAYTGDVSSAGRISGQVVSGIGFLGAGVIMREGLNIRGLNTAATLWCSAAIGVLCGMGLLVEAALGAVVILCANIVLRDAALRINRLNVVDTEMEQRYAIHIVCHADDEVHVRTLLLHTLSNMSFTLQSLLSRDLEDNNCLLVSAEILAQSGHQSQLEQIVSRVSLEKSVTSVRWTLLAEHDDLAESLHLLGILSSIKKPQRSCSIGAFLLNALQCYEALHARESTHQAWLYYAPHLYRRWWLITHRLSVLWSLYVDALPPASSL